MFQDFSQNRSPVSNRYGGNGLPLNRQPSRQFEQYNHPLQGLYTFPEDHAAQYDGAPRHDRIPAATLHNNYGYDNQTWNYGGANGSANMMGGTGRIKPSARRTGIPSVSHPILLSNCW